MYKLKSTNGRVNFLLRTGKDFVKNDMSTSAAQHIIDTGELGVSDKPDYPICVSGKWYFEGEETKPKETNPTPQKTTAKTKMGRRVSK